jgi:hypothetical protein
LRNIISLKKNSAIFLATLLIIGTISTIVPSIQAEPYYGADKDRKQVNVDSLKCNNININVNGLELDVFPSLLGGEVTAEATEGQTDANSFANNNGGSNSGSQINDFRFTCINNNNNTVIEETPTPPEKECPEADDIEACFEQFLPEGQFEELVDALESQAGITVEINGQDVTLRSFADICSALEGLTVEQLREAVLDILREAFGEDRPVLKQLTICIEEALGIEDSLPPPP